MHQIWSRFSFFVTNCDLRLSTEKILSHSLLQKANFGAALTYHLKTFLQVTDKYCEGTQLRIMEVDGRLIVRTC